MPFPIMAAVELAAEFLPGVIRHLAGDKAGDVADKVVGVAQSITGKNSPEDAATALRANPELLVKYRIEMAHVEIEHERMFLEDRQDARARDTIFAKVGRRNWRADIMLALAFAGVAFLSWLLLTYRVDGATAIGGFLIATGGALVKMIGDAFAFEFGSSRSSKDKDATLAALARH